MTEGVGLDIHLGTQLGSLLGLGLCPNGHTIVTPASILGAGYYADFRADDNNRVMNGSKVAAGYNYGLDASDALQASAGRQPTYNAANFNGGPSWAFSAGSNTLMVATLNTPVAAGGRVYCWLVAANVPANNIPVALQDTAFTDGILCPYASAGSKYGVARRQDASNIDLAVSATDADSGRRLFKFGYTVGGTASLVLKEGATNAAHDYVSTGGLKVLTIGDVVGAGVVPATFDFVRLIVWHNPATPTALPSGAALTAMDTYLNGQNFANYNGSSYGL